MELISIEAIMTSIIRYNEETSKKHILPIFHNKDEERKENLKYSVECMQQISTKSFSVGWNQSWVRMMLITWGISNG